MTKTFLHLLVVACISASIFAQQPKQSGTQKSKSQDETFKSMMARIPRSQPAEREYLLAVG